MPQTVLIALNPHSNWDRFTVGVLDSAASHDRNLATIAGLVLTHAAAVNAAAVAHNRHGQMGNFTVNFGNLTAIFRAPTANEAAQGWNVVLFHVDMTKTEKTQQKFQKMQERFYRDDNNNTGGGSSRSVKA